jgi:hypothetical protein
LALGPWTCRTSSPEAYFAGGVFYFGLSIRVYL